MESEILRKMAINWIGDERIKAIVEDCDNRSNSVYRSLNWKIKRLLDANHLRKHFRTILNKYKDIDYLHSSIIKYFNSVIKSNESDEIRKDNWRNMYNHFNDNHEKCQHGKLTGFNKIKEANKESLQDLINKTLNFIEKTEDIKINTTNWNESFNHLRLFFCPKLISTKISFKYRSAIAVLFWNNGPRAHLILMDKMKMVPSVQIKEYINKVQQIFEKNKQMRRGTEFRKRENTKRKTFRESNKKQGPNGYILELTDGDDDDEEEDINDLNGSDTVPDSVFEKVGTEIIEKLGFKDKSEDTCSSVILQTLDHNVARIRNILNSCYINAALQVIFRIYPIYDYILNNSHTNWLFDNLKKACVCCSKGTVIDSNTLNYYINQLLTVHTEGIQEDSGEILLKLLGFLVQIDKTTIEKSILIEYNKECICQSCKAQITIKENNLILPIAIPVSNVTIEVKSLIQSFQKPSFNTLKRYCDKCGRDSNFNYQHSFTSLKEYIILMLDRFYQFGKTKKIHTTVLINQVLEFCGFNYSFVGSINHKGEKDNGHYYNYILNEGRFYYVSDMVNEETDFKECDNTTYILLYKRIDFNHE